jgi:excisionase family DNA binding protein
VQLSDRLLTARELAERWSLSADTILDRWQRGEIPGYRIGGKAGSPVRFRESDIDALEESWRREAA